MCKEKNKVIPTRPSDVRKTLKNLGLKPCKNLGQHFLIDANIRDLILASAQIQPGEEILEIGPGLGVLTGKILDAHAHLTAIEKDFLLFSFLKQNFKAYPNLKLIHADALKVDLKGMKLISNLPYSVGNRIIMELAQSIARPAAMTVTVQLDVAHRFTASPGKKEYGVLSIISQMYYDIKIIKKISENCFYPSPQVKSAVVHFTRLSEPRVQIPDQAIFVELVKKSFSQRRKQLKNILNISDLPGIDATRRPETLSVEEWGALAGKIEKL